MSQVSTRPRDNRSDSAISVYRYKVTAFYPAYPGLHPLDDAPREASAVVEAADERSAALHAVVEGRLPVALADRGNGRYAPTYWRPGMYGTARSPEVVSLSPSEVVLGFGENLNTHRLTLSVCPADEDPLFAT